MPDIRYGPFRLAKHPNSPKWKICWYDADARQVRWKSTGTSEIEDARRFIERHFLTWQAEKARQYHPDDPLHPRDVEVIDVLASYCEHLHGRPRYKQARYAVAHLVGTDEEPGFFDGKKVSELRKPAQRDFAARMIEVKGLSYTYTSDVLGVLRAALKFAVDNDYLESAPTILNVPKNAPTDRAWTLDQLAAFINAIDSARLWTFTMVAINTLCRPNANFDLKIFQCDFDHGLIDLNPAGRTQTKKYRPIVPMTEAIRWWIQYPDCEYITSWHGERIGSLKKAFKETAIRAGLPENSSPYSIRHGMARALRALGTVPADQVAGILGHKGYGMSTTERYAPYAPAYLSAVREGIDTIVLYLETASACQLRGSSSIAAYQTETAEDDNGFDYNALPLSAMVGERGFEPPAPTSRRFGADPVIVDLQRVRRKRKGPNGTD